MDRSARERIRTSLDESLIVEAAAGTGKTTELVRRIVALLGSGRTTPDRLVAVTFTRKAAGELKLRIREELDRARMADPQEERRGFLEQSVARLEEAHIGTIHSFCAEILRERPIEAGIDPAFEELAEDEAPRFFEKAYRPWVESRLLEMPVAFRRLLSRTLVTQSWNASSPLEQIKGAALKFLEWRDFTHPWKTVDFNRKREINTLAVQVVELADLSRDCRRYRDELRKTLQPVRDLAAWIRRRHQEGYRDHDRLEAFLLDLLKKLKHPFNRKKGRGRYGAEATREQVLGHREELIQDLENFRVLADADLAALLQDEFTQLVSRYEDLKLRSGKLDFVDLLVKTRDLLRGDEAVRALFQERFSHIFVDEFQDTDPLQAEILLLLAADDRGLSNWRKVRPVPGKLFLVGDPKQSIYRFRRADVILYREIREQLERGGVGRVHLTRSFRSVPELQEVVNSAFGDAMEEDPEAGQPEYIPLNPFRPSNEARPSLVVLPVPEPYGKFQVANYAIEKSFPQAAGAFLQWLLRESGWQVADPESPDRSIPIEPRHVALLFRRFASWGGDVTRPYTRELEARQIPHVLVGSRSFHEREEVESLRTALTAVEWPDDELSVYATLRGTLFAIQDQHLFWFREEYGKLHPFRRLPEELPEPLEPIRRALSFLADLHRRRNRRPFVQTLTELLEHTRAHAGFALRPAGQQVLANIQRVSDIGRNFEAAGGTSFRSLVEYLQEQAEQGSAESPVLEEGVDGVRLMTVHSAKGLEFPMVLLADPTCRLGAANPDRYVDLDRNLAAFSLLGCRPLDLLEHEEEERRRDLAEGVRVAYVAATRARDILVVPAVGDEPRDGWLQVFHPAIYPSREEWRSAEQAEGCPSFGESSVRTRPVEMDGRSEISVSPGRIRPEKGEHSVVWWDPGVLELNVAANFGLRQEQILAESERGERKGLVRYERWRSRRRALIEAGSEPTYRLRSVTEDLVKREAPESFPVEIARVEVDPHRPGGRRFGTLVHTLLRDVGFDSAPEEIENLARLQGKLLGARKEEVEAASRAVRQALDHSWLREAARAAEAYREVPFLINLESGELAEGTIDLLLRDEDRWWVLDFKTDVTLAEREADYRRQVQWYAHAVKELQDTSDIGCRILLL